MSGATPSGPSDTGLAGERTSLAWARIGLTLLGLPSALLAYATGRNVVAMVAAAAAAMLGLAVLTLSVRRQRAVPGMVDRRRHVLAAGQVALTGGCVLLLSLAGLVLVLE